MTISSLNTISSLFKINKQKEKEIVNSYIDKINIKTPSQEQLIRI